MPFGLVRGLGPPIPEDAAEAGRVVAELDCGVAAKLTVLTVGVVAAVCSSD